ncbi:MULTISPECIES: hypothetical protein [Actinosynnema]|uniref:hypothetical protein n=1 Tax=Actinosynnema TaxID=40566 RepID=UPI0020A3AB2F|nr:hypothetical protein [Actinosynnema pretiosum]MCP2099456.1 hypothetical protein [Actinosynnema pretiosum]
MAEQGSAGEKWRSRLAGRLRRITPDWLTGISGMLVGIAALLPFVLQAGEVVAGPPVTVTETFGSTVTRTSTVTNSASASPAPSADGSGAAPLDSPGVGPSGAEPVGAPVERPSATTPPAPAGTTAPRVDAPPSTGAPAPEPELSAASVYYSGDVVFRSLHLDRKPPVDVPEHNVWRITENRLYGDDTYQLQPWPGSTVPSRAECAATVADSPKRDAEHLRVGSLVCGKTPEGRLFRIEVLALTPSEITARLVVWDR